MGCPLEINEVGGEIIVKGNTCPRGKQYGVQEYTAPKRTVTTLVKLAGGGVVSIKTSNPIPKEKIFDLLDYVKTLTADNDCKIGDILVKDALSLGADLIITGRP